MPRKPRTLYEGSIYHIYQRGNNKAFIFNDNKHKQFFIKQLHENNKVFDFQLLAYVVMSNHYHLIIKSGKDSLSDVMFHINNVYCKYINRELGRTGHAVEGRFHAKSVDNEAYLIWLLRYVHRNPLRANLCTSLDAYKWSSHYYYKNALSSDLINPKIILSLLSQDKNTAISTYLKLVNHQGNDANIDEDLLEIQDLLDLSNMKSRDLNAETKMKIERKSLEEILQSQNINESSRTLLVSGSKKHYLTEYKINFIKEALVNKYNIKDIAEFLNSNEGSLYKLLSRHDVSL